MWLPYQTHLQEETPHETHYSTHPLRLACGM